MMGGLGELEHLPLERRLLRYHELSDDAFVRAAAAGDESERDRLMSMGKGWRLLALETEETLRRLRALKP
jgi:hypothetical protein